MAFPNGIYAPPGVYTQTNLQPPNQGAGAAARLPLVIGPGSEILTQTALEIVRGSSASVDQRVVQEDEAGRAVVSISPAGQITLGAFDGTLDRVQVRNYPIVSGNGSGTTATDTSSVAVTVNSIPVVVLNIDGARGILRLSVKPAATDDVRVTYYFNRTDTLITDTVSDQVTPDAGVLYGAVGQNYDVVTGSNDELILTIDDATALTVTVAASPVGGWTAAQIAAFVNGAATGTSLVASTAINNFGVTVLKLTADRNILIGNGSLNATLGFTTGAYTARNNVFYVFQRPIVDGSNGGITTTDPADVTVKVNGTQVIPTAVDGQSGAVTLPFAPESGAAVTVQYYFNSWQDTFDYLANRGVTEVTLCGLTPDRDDFVENVDFVLQDDQILWGTAVTTAAGEHTAGSATFGESQVIPTLVDVREYLAPCEAFVNTSVNPAVENRVQFVLPLTPTTGNGRNSPLGTTTFNQVANGRVDLPTNRPDLVFAYWGFSLQDAIERGRVTVTKVESDTATITLAEPVPVGAEVYATFYYNTIQDVEYTVTAQTAGPSGVGTYSITNQDGAQVLVPSFGSKSAGLATVQIQFPSGSERLPDVRFETPYTTTGFEGPVAEDVTVEFAQRAATPAKYAVPSHGPYYPVSGDSDGLDIAVDGTTVSVDLSDPTGAGCGFFAQVVGNEAVYDPATGGSTFEIDATNDAIDLLVDGVLIQSSAGANVAATVADYVSAINTAALSEPPVLKAVTRFSSPLTVSVNEYDRITIHYTGDVSLASGNLTATIAPGTYNTATTLAAAVNTALDTAIGALPFSVAVTANTSSQLEFALALQATATATVTAFPSTATLTIGGQTLTPAGGARTPGANNYDNTLGTVALIRADIVAAINDPANDFTAIATASSGAGGLLNLTAVPSGPLGLAVTLVSSTGTITVSGATFAVKDSNGFLEFITNAAPARDFCITAGLSTDGAALGNQTKLFQGEIARSVSLGVAPLLYDRIIVRNRIVPGSGSIDGQSQLDQCELQIVGGTGASQAGLTAQERGYAGLRATIMEATAFGRVSYASQAANSQPQITFYAAGGVNDQNNVFKFTMDGQPYTVVFTNGAGVAIPVGGSAAVSFGPIGLANSVLWQINNAITGSGSVQQEGAGIRFRSGSSEASAQVVIGDGNANSTLGFSTNAASSRTVLTPQVLVSGLMANANASVADYLLDFTSPSANYFTDLAIAKTVSDQAGADYLYLQSLTLGTASSLAFESNTALRPGVGLGVVVGDGNVGEAAIDGFFVTSSDPANGSGSVNNSLLNSGDGQDGQVGQTYRDLVTGLTFTILARAGGADYPAGQSFTFKVRVNATCDSNLPNYAVPGIQLIVANTTGVAVGDTALLTTHNRSGAQPAVGDVYYVSYNYRKQDFSAQLFTRLSSIEAAYGANSPTNPVSLASYLTLLNGAVLVAVKQVPKDQDSNADGTNDSASTAAYIAAIDDCEGALPGGVYPDILVPLKGDDATLFSYIAKHCDIQSSIRYRAERTAICGFSAGTQPRDAGNIASGIARTRMRMVYPDIATLTVSRADATTDSYLVDGTFVAAAVAGTRVAPTVDVATPWTNTRIFGFDRLARPLDAVEQNQVAVKGVTVIENINSVIRIRQGFTTDMSNILTKTPTVIQIADEVQKQARATLDRFVGVKFLPGITSQIEGQLSSTLKDLVAAQIITGFTGVSARVSPDDPTVCEVTAAIAPVFPLLYIVVTFNLRSSL